jgi:hypothetical protein
VVGLRSVSAPRAVSQGETLAARFGADVLVPDVQRLIAECRAKAADIGGCVDAVMLRLTS